MSGICPRCDKSFNGRHGVRMHQRQKDCAAGKRPSAGDESADDPYQVPKRTSTRPLPKNMPLAKDRLEFGPAAPRNHRDNYILDDADAYWESARASGGVPEVERPLQAHQVTVDMMQDGTGSSLPTVPEHDRLDSTDSQAARARSREVTAAAKHLVFQLVQKAGALLVDRLLKVVTSGEWAEIFSDDSPERNSEHATSVRSWRNARNSIEKEMTEGGADSDLSFEKKTIFPDPSAADGTTGPGLEVHLRSPVGVVMRQLQRASAFKQNFHFEPMPAVDRNRDDIHRDPMSASIAHEVFTKVKREIENSEDDDVFWSEEESFITPLQFYSDKSAMSLKSSALSFYPFHISLLAFTSQEKNDLVRNDETLVALLPVASKWPSRHSQRPSFDASGEPVPLDPPNNLKKQKTSHKRMKRSENSVDNLLELANLLPTVVPGRDIVAKALVPTLEELKRVAAKGIEFTDADGKKRKAHLVLTSYVADTPEVSTLTCVNQTLCPRCDISKSRMGAPDTTGNVRTARITDAVLEVHGMLKEWHGHSREELVEAIRARPNQADLNFVLDRFRGYALSGLSRYPPFFLDWPFVAVDPALDTYRIMRFDLMHAMPQGLLKTLVTCVSDRLKSDSLHTDIFVDRKKNPKTLQRMRKPFLNAANNLLTLIAREAPATNWSVRFPKGKFFTDTDSGFASMLEAKDMVNCQQVLPFVAATIDKLCGLESSTRGRNEPDAPMTSVFVAYHELYARLAGKNRDEIGYTAKELDELGESIASFKGLVLEVFRDFQASEFCFPKFHALEHVVQDIKDLGCLSSFSSDVYETSHCFFKSKNRATSRRHETQLEETTNKIVMGQALQNSRMRLAGGRGSGTGSGDVEPRGWAVEALLAGKRVQSAYETLSSLRDEDSIINPNALPRAVHARDADRAKRISEMTGKEAAIAIDSCCIAGRRGRGIPYAVICGAVQAAAGSAGGGGGGVGGGTDSETLKRIPQTDERFFIASLGGAALAKKAIDLISAQACEYGERTLNSSLDPSELILDLIRRCTTHKLVFHFAKSAHVAGFPTPSLVNQGSAKDVTLPNDGSRVLQKIISAVDGYSHMTVGRQDSVMVEKGDDLSGGTGTNGMSVWFAKVLLLTHVHAKFGRFGGTGREELAVVRYYEILDKNTLDAADQSLYCVKLKWAIDSHGDPWIDVLPASSIRGRVHIVPDDAPRAACAISGFNSKYDAGDDVCDFDPNDLETLSLEEGEDMRLNESDGGAMFFDSADWKKRKFFVNRFKFNDHNDIMYNKKDRDGDLQVDD